MEFVTIDFETATDARNSACEIGLTFVENGEIKQVKQWLIKPPSYPYFNYFNVRVHGIKPQQVANAPTFAELWPELHPLVEGKLLIAHNASFDMGVLRGTLDYYKLPYPNVSYCCSYIFSKRAWDGLRSYGLKNLCREHNIPLNHHRAGDDAEATAKMILKAFAHVGLERVEQLPEKLRVIVGQIYPGGYQSCASVPKKKGKLQRQH